MREIGKLNKSMKTVFVRVGRSREIREQKKLGKVFLGVGNSNEGTAFNRYSVHLASTRQFCPNRDINTASPERLSPCLITLLIDFSEITSISTHFTALNAHKRRHRRQRYFWETLPASYPLTRTTRHLRLQEIIPQGTWDFSSGFVSRITSRGHQRPLLRSEAP